MSKYSYALLYLHPFSNTNAPNPLNMLCRHCRPFLLPSPPTLTTLLSTTLSNKYSTQTPPTATSTSAAQPFSTPLTPSPSRSPALVSTSTAHPIRSTAPTHPVPAVPKSSVSAGTPLRGLGFLKGKEGPVAGEDEEYPSWLWGLLDKGSKGKADGTEGEGGDLFCEFPEFPSFFNLHALFFRARGQFP